MTNNFFSKLNNFFILTVFILSIIAIQFGFLKTLNFFYFSSIDLFLIIILLICISTKKIKKIIVPIILISLLGCLYISNNIIITFTSYIVMAIIIFYLNKGPLFTTDFFKLFLLCVISILIFKTSYFILSYGYNIIFTKQFLFIFEQKFIFSLVFQIIYSTLILFLFKPDIKYINYEFLVGD